MADLRTSTTRRVSLRKFWVLACTTCAVLLGSAAASVATASAAEVTSTYAVTGVNGFSQFNFVPVDNEHSSAVLSRDETFHITGLDGNGQQQTMVYNYAGTAQSSYGVLRAMSHSSIDNTFFNTLNDPYDPNTGVGAPRSLSGQTNAYFRDLVDLTGNTNVHAVQLVVRMTGHVAQDADYQFSSGSAMLWQPSPSSDTAMTNILASRVDFDENRSFDFTITTGPLARTSEGLTRFELRLQLNTSWLLANSAGTTQFIADGSSVSSSANLFSTAEIIDVIATDANGNRTSLGPAIGLSGTDYGQMVIPEPASALMLLAAAGLLHRRTGRRHHHAA